MPTEAATSSGWKSGSVIMVIVFLAFVVFIAMQMSSGVKSFTPTRISGRGDEPNPFVGMFEGWDKPPTD